MSLLISDPGIAPEKQRISLRRRLAGSPWLEAGAFLFVLGELALLMIFRGGLSTYVEAALWMQWGMTLLGLGALGWMPVMGPVFFFDLVRSGRKNRLFLVRILYAIFLAIVITSLFLNSWIRWDIEEYLEGRQAAKFAANFFYLFLSAQYAVVIFLTPAYTAGAIADEKERKTLDFILASDLRNSEVVLGKLGSRLMTMGLLLLTGLPVISLVQLLGGVDPQLVTAGFTATFMTLLGLAGLSIYNSVTTGRARDAIFLTYLEMLAYFIFSLLNRAFIDYVDLDDASLWTFQSDSFTFVDAANWINAGNPLDLLFRLQEHLRSNGDLVGVLPTILRQTFVFYLGLGGLCLKASILKVRAVALRQSLKSSRRGRNLKKRTRPAVGSRPMIWKELFVERGPTFHWAGRLAMVFLIFASFIPVFMMIIKRDPNSISGLNSISRHMNEWVRYMNALVLPLFLLAVGVRAAGAISGERDRKTLDDLLTSPLDSDAILFGKWLGSVLSVRKGWLWVAAIWGLGLMFGGLSLFAVFLLLVAWIIYASLIAGLGLWFSLNCRSNIQATMWTLGTTITVAIGYWFFFLLLIPFWTSLEGDVIQTAAKFGAGISPPTAFAVCFSFGNDPASQSEVKESIELILYGLAGLAFWAIVAGILTTKLRNRFRVVAKREDFIRRRKPNVAALAAN